MQDHRDFIGLYDLGHIEEHSPGMIHWHPQGVSVLRRLENYILEVHQKKGYMEVRSPILLSKQLWEQSGHWDKYQHLMFADQSEESRMAVKPMSCPGHVAIYAHKKRSYRDLPFRLFEFGHVHRKEMSGSLSGWMRLRGFVQDDSHVLCAQDDIQHVVADFACMVEEVYRHFGFQQWKWRMALRPDRRAGCDDVWDKAEQSLRDACLSLGIEAEECPGEGAFYGPKLEVALVDRLGREWQCGVAQVDFVLPERFSLSYQHAGGHMEQPVMIHHAVLGSLERWLSIVMEHHCGLPDWLSPHDIAVLPVSEQYNAYAHMVAAQARGKGRLVKVFSDGPLGGRVREVERLKYVSIVVVGQREQEARMVQLRGAGARGLDDWIQKL